MVRFVSCVSRQAAFDKDSPQFSTVIAEKTLCLGLSTVRFRDAEGSRCVLLLRDWTHGRMFADLYCTCVSMCLCVPVRDSVCVSAKLYVRLFTAMF